MPKTTGINRLEVIGAGFGRTGTHSLKLALEHVGLGPCYHMSDVIGNPSHVELWRSSSRNGARYWGELFDGYRSAVDWPACHYWRELLKRNDGARVILTTRDADEWFDDARDTIFRAIAIGRRLRDPLRRARCEMAGKMIFEETFSDRHEDRDHAIARYRRHIDEVRSEVPRERLLEFDVTEGWEPLCSFLGRPVPDEKFPASNSREAFLAALLSGGI